MERQQLFDVGSVLTMQIVIRPKATFEQLRQALKAPATVMKSFLPELNWMPPEKRTTQTVTIRKTAFPRRNFPCRN